MANIISERKIPLWKAKWDKAALEAKKRSLTQQAYARGFEQRPFSEEDRLFALADVANAVKPNLSVDEVKEMSGYCFTGVDLAGPKRAGTAFFTIKVVGVGVQAIRYPVDIRVGKFKGQQMIDQFAQIEAEWKSMTYMVENNAVQSRVIDMLGLIPATASLPVAEYFTGKQKMDIDIGLPSLSLEFQNGLWHIPWRGRGRKDNPPDGHGALCNCAWCQWYYEEIMMYPMSETSDLLIAFWLAREAFRKTMGTLTIFEHFEPPTQLGRFRM